MLVGWHPIRRYYSLLWETILNINASIKRSKTKIKVKKLLQYVNDDIEKHEQDAKEYFKKVDELMRKM